MLENKSILNQRWITEPTKNNFQVRIKKNRIEKSRLFSARHWGGRGKALKAAISWRDQLAIVMDVKPNRKEYDPISNKSTGVLGITKRCYTDSRKKSPLTYLIYSVNWKDHTGKRRNKVFQVGNIEDYQCQIDELAFETAKAFRKEYEKHWDSNTLEKFDTGKYLGWKDNWAA